MILATLALRTCINHVQLSDEWADTQIDVAGYEDVPASKGALNSLAELKKKYNQLKVVLSVGGGGEGSKPFAGVCCDPAKRDQFARSSFELVQRFGIDGIDSKLVISLMQDRRCLRGSQSTGNTRRTAVKATTTFSC